MQQKGWAGPSRAASMELLQLKERSQGARLIERWGGQSCAPLSNAGLPLPSELFGWAVFAMTNKVLWLFELRKRAHASTS